MCYECKFMSLLRDNEDKLFAVCTHREADFLCELDYAFSNCGLGVIDDEKEED